MAQIIVSSRYLKSGKREKTKRRNYTKYIATRESVEKRSQNTGKTTGLNCHDVEKVRRLNEKYKDYKVIESYSDSIKSDRPILELAERAYQVKKNRLILLDLNK